MFIKEALAQTAQTVVATEQVTAGTPMGMKIIAQFALIFLVLYFLLIRPQQKKLKKHESDLNAITKGTKVVVGGILGTVTKVEDNGELKIKIANDVEISVLRGYVSQVIFDEKAPVQKDNKKGA